MKACSASDLLRFRPAVVRGLRVLIPVFLLAAALTGAQDLRGTTDDGRRVLLKADGTWQFIPSSPSAAQGPLASFAKPASASSVLRLNDDKVAIWYDPGLWTLQTDSEPTRKTFIHKDGDLYAVVIAERVGATIDGLRQIALTNMKQADPNARVTFEDNRIVNGKQILCMKLEATLQGLQFVYLGYYYADDSGIVQDLVFTSRNLFSRYEAVLTDFLNGMIVGN